MFRLSLAAVTAALVFSSPPVAHAITMNVDSTFTFTGTCSDCGASPEATNDPPGVATATLVLQNYTLGDTLTNTNFVSFTYTSALQGTLTAERFITFGLDNVLDNLPGPENVTIAFTVGGDLYNFISSTSSNWQLIKQTPVDQGTDLGTWSAAATPLPATLPLFATGLGGLGLLGWRRRRKTGTA